MGHRRQTYSAKIERACDLLRLLSDPTRFHIMLLLMKNRRGVAVYELAEALNLSHSAVSHQLGNLEDAGVVSGERDGQMVLYRIVRSAAAWRALRIMRLF